MCYLKCPLHGRSCRCGRIAMAKAKNCYATDQESGIIEHNSCYIGLESLPREDGFKGYTAQLCGCDACNNYYMGDAGERHRAWADLFSSKLECSTDVINVFGTLTFAPSSVSPTNVRNDMFSTSAKVDDPPIGLQKTENCFQYWKDTIQEALGGWRMRKLLAVTEHGSDFHTGRMHIHFVMCVSDYLGKREVSQLLEFLEQNPFTRVKRWPYGSVKLLEAENKEGASSYLAKYMSKDQSAHDTQERFWYYDGETLSIPRHIVKQSDWYRKKQGQLWQ